MFHKVQIPCMCKTGISLPHAVYLVLKEFLFRFLNAIYMFHSFQYIANIILFTCTSCVSVGIASTPKFLVVDYCSSFPHSLDSIWSPVSLFHLNYFALIFNEL